jgi:hypothetical protein
MDNDYSTRTPIVVCALKNNADPFRSKEEVVLGTEYSYLSVIDAPLYLTNNTRLDITFCRELSYKTTRLLQCVIETASRISHDN